MKGIRNSQLPSLSQREVNVLLALAAGELSGYQIVRQCQEDSAGEVSLSNGTLFPALQRLERSGAIEEMPAKAGGPGKGRRVYRITRTGRLTLEWQLSAYRRMVRLGQDRI